MVKTSGEDRWQVPICRTRENQPADAQGHSSFPWSAVPTQIKAPGTLVTFGNKVHERANRGGFGEEAVNYSFIM